MRVNVGLWALMGALVLAACSRHEPREDCGDSVRVVDPALLAFLSKARSAHHVADQYEASGDRAAALRALQGLTAGPVPAGTAPEVEEVLADTRARSAELLSQVGRFDQADEELKQGLEHAPIPTYFRGHLFEVRGLVEERREKALRGNARGQEADQARERSLNAYEEAMKIQAQVIGTGIGSAAATPTTSAAPRP
jgi:tetratricopeptide (TPR) repeat protein